MLSLLQNFLNLSETKLVPASDIILCGIPYSANMTFVVVSNSLLIAPPFFYYWEFAVVIYYTQIIFIIKVKYICI